MHQRTPAQALKHSAILSLVCLFVAACAPHLERAGPRTAAPVLGAQHIVTGDGMRLPIRVWQAEGEPSAVVLALHGFNDYSKSFEEAAKFWTVSGIITYAYDQRGFGAAPHPGRFATTETLTADLAAASHLLRNRHPRLPLYLLGESMGAAVIMAGIAGSDRPAISPQAFDGIILAAPAVWGRKTMNPFMRAALWIGAHTIPWFRVSARGLKIRPSDNIEMLRALARDPLIIRETRIDSLYGLVNLMDAALAAAPRLQGRMLILYGANEELIPGRSVDSLLQRLPENSERRIAHYKTGYHMLLRDLGAAKVYRDVAAWISAPDAPLPSGADLVQR
jgi:alpha-beta hydrolase superfamily lysophospholipase